jgi:hypothetical protein
VNDVKMIDENNVRKPWERKTGKKKKKKKEKWVN